MYYSSKLEVARFVVEVAQLLLEIYDRLEARRQDLKDRDQRIIEQFLERNGIAVLDHEDASSRPHNPAQDEGVDDDEEGPSPNTDIWEDAGDWT